MRKWGRWVAAVWQPKSRERIWLGSCYTPQEDARAYDAAVFCLRGQSVLLNIPANQPEIPPSDDLSPSQIQEAASSHAHRFQQRPRRQRRRSRSVRQLRIIWLMAEAHDHDGLTCNMQYQSPRLWTF